MTIHFQDIIAVVPRIASYADFPLPFMTAFRIIFSRTLFGDKCRNMCP